MIRRTTPTPCFPRSRRISQTVQIRLKTSRVSQTERATRTRGSAPSFASGVAKRSAPIRPLSASQRSDRLKRRANGCGKGR